MDTSNKLIHDFNKKTPTSSKTNSFAIILIVGAIILGTLTGFVTGKAKASSEPSMSPEKAKSGEAAGIVDKSTFKDKAEGLLKEGGSKGEGSFHLERPGGVSQTVYLTSSAVDLSQFVGKKVRVWGETHSSDKVGWLMDVGYVEAL